MSVLIKVSGDLIYSKKLYDWLSVLNNSYDNLVILCGGGTAITEKLKQENIKFKFKKNDREIISERGKRLAYEVLQENRNFMEKMLEEKGIRALVEVPVMIFGSKICHFNGDEFLRNLYRFFDKLIIVTLTGREKPFVKKYKKIEVVHL